MPNPLTREMLDRFETTLGDHGAPVVSTRDAIREDSLHEPTPVSFAFVDEVRLWWRWSSEQMAGSECPFGFSVGLVTLMSLSDATVATEEMAEIDRKAGISDELQLWNDDWLVIARSGNGYLTCECNRPEGSTSPVGYFSYDTGLEDTSPIVESIGDLVAFWTEAIERGLLRYDVERAEWIEGPPWEGLPEDMLALI